MPIFRPSISVSSLNFCRSSDAQRRHLVSRGSPLFLQETSVIFVLKRRRVALEKAEMTSALPVAILAIGGSIAQAPTRTSQPDDRTSSSQIKTPVVLLGSSDSISGQNAVKETREGISDDVPDLEECFEFESSPSSIPIVKGRLRAHYNVWSHNLGASDFILRTIDKGYAVPFITVSPKAFFGNHKSALAHANLVWEAVQELLYSGSVVQVPNPPQVVNPLSVSIQSFGKKRLILDLRHVNKHIWKAFIFHVTFSCLNLTSNLAITILIF